MNSESKLIIELWDYFRDIIGASKRQDAALHLLRLFDEYSIDYDKTDIQGECDYLDEAVSMLSDDEEEDSSDDNWDED